MRYQSSRLALSVALAAGIQTVQAQEPSARLAWTIDVEAPIRAAQWGASGDCVAVATDEAVHVIDAGGKRLWDWNYRETSRFLRLPRYFSPLAPFAVAPACDAVVLGGDSSYRYVLSADRGGGRHVLKTAGTPLGIRFDPTGQTVAVVTGASKGYLLSPALRVRWSGATADLPIRWPAQTGDARSVSGPVFAQGDVDALFGALLWGYGVADDVSEDGQWRAVAHVPFRGAGEGSVELWGPEAGGYRGRRETRGEPRWRKPMGCPNTMKLARDGLFLMVQGDPDHPDAERTLDSPQCDVVSTYVFDRDGQLVLTWPPRQDLRGLPAAVLAKTGRPFVGDVPGPSSEPPWRAPYEPEERSPVLFERYSSDGSRLWVVSEKRLRFYHQPQQAVVDTPAAR
jgi:hypothetical protein